MLVITPGEEFHDARFPRLSLHGVPCLPCHAEHVLDVVAIAREKEAPVAAHITAEIEIRRAPRLQRCID
jgi:hypothetical protein